MPLIQPIPAVGYACCFDGTGADISDFIAPPYDVLDARSKAALLARSDRNIVTIDLPHLPAKSVGPDSAYRFAGDTYARWLSDGTLVRRDQATLFAYRQTFTARGRRYERSGIIANVPVQPFGKSPDGQGGIFPHEQTFADAKEDRLKLMRATGAQLSPIFGMHNDPAGQTGTLLAEAMQKPASFHGRTADGVLHEVWTIMDTRRIAAFQDALREADIFIADGHHRYNTALNYRNELLNQGQRPGGADHCLFVLISMQDPGMIVLPTHRVLGGLTGFTFADFEQAARGKGFLMVSATPLTRSSYHAGDDFARLRAARMAKLGA